MNFIRIILFPFSLLYGIVISLRNKMFDWKILPSQQFHIPIISIGNLSYGGTGKTPHIEYLIRLLKDKYNIATLSRGYGRSSKGFVLAMEDSDYKEIGDESLQYKQNFENIEVAVDNFRRRGIKILINTIQKLNVILLDDAFQHRYVKPGMSILLTDFRKLYVNDYILPCGTLRECRRGAKRADIIIVTKTDTVFSPITRRRLTKLIKPKAYQRLYFSYVTYGEKMPVPGIENKINKKNFNTILLFSGIANSYPFQEHLKKYCQELIVLDFPDHHKYTIKDLNKIIEAYNDVFSKNKIIITTEKDAMRLIKTELIKYIKDFPVYYIPITIKFHKDDAAKFDKQILNYVAKNQKVSRVHKK